MADFAADFTCVARSMELYHWAKTLIPGATQLISGRRILRATPELRIGIDRLKRRAERNISLLVVHAVQPGVDPVEHAPQA